MESLKLEMLIYQRLNVGMSFSEFHRVSLTDLNRRPPTCEAGALPTELWTQNTKTIVLNFCGCVKRIVLDT